MNSSALATSLPFSSSLQLNTSSLTQNSTLRFAGIKPLGSPSFTSLRLRVSSNYNQETGIANTSVIHNLKSLAKTAIIIGATASVFGRFSHFPAKAESPVAITEQNIHEEEQEETETQSENVQSSPLSEFLESNTEAVEALRSLLEQKLENGEDEEGLRILEKLTSAQPESTEWKFLTARLLNEMGKTSEARKVFEEILSKNPLSFEALFENALLMDRSGEGEAVIKRLEEALSIAEEENKTKEARDVKLIMAQIQFLQKNVEDALNSYDELTKQDPKDFRPYFCRGMIYSLMDKNSEAKEQFAKYKELSPRKFEVEGYLRTPLSRMKLFEANKQD